ncbi:glycosyltransferase involved in cell wall biosynthesis [Nitrosospira sp. Nsp2]|nr:glycosyltransferase involved in cell wall biosynthesis [Nitrosospira sp. Nsp2]
MLKPEPLLSFIFRVFVKPVLDFLPELRRNQIMTIAHHVKTTLFYGHVMNFSDNWKPIRIMEDKKANTRAAAASNATVPAWVVEELRHLAEIEPDLFPTPQYLSQFNIYRPTIDAAPGMVYADCRRLVGDTNPDIIIIVPWLKRGGADLGTLHHINVCRRLGLSAVLITTLDTVSPWLERVPKDVPVVELGRVGRKITQAQRMTVLVRLVLQSRASTIHIIQSQLGWDMLKAHGKSLQAEGKSVFASLYCEDHDSTGQKHGYARYYLASTLPYLTGVICDSAYYPAELSRHYGVDSRRTHTVYFPGTSVRESEYISTNQGKVLWASRITQQKRPDLLLKIATAMPDIQFHVRGHAEKHDEKQMESNIRRLPNIIFTGSYEVGGLVEENDQFSLFLYTSLTDGMPNVLLEATLAGLPIVASAVGGVPELINDETGYPVADTESVNAYVSAIRKALSNPEERHNRWGCALELVRKRHTQESFFQQMVEIKDYFPGTAKETPRLRALA